tara:strand:+ start:632 stop:838 length:207 start_codon:yes stop_codon:yes gene_type:complete
MSDAGSESDGSEYIVEEIDLTTNPLYQVLSTLLEDSQGNNICECINNLTNSINNHNQLVLQLLEKLNN